MTMTVLSTVGMTPTDFGFHKTVVYQNNNIHGKCYYFLGWSATGRLVYDGRRKKPEIHKSITNPFTE